MRKIEKIKAGFRLCTILVLYILFFVTQLVSVNERTQHASVFIYSPAFHFLPAAPADDTLQADEIDQTDEEDTGIRVNKRFSNKASITLSSFSILPAPLKRDNDFREVVVSLNFFRIIPNKLLRGPPTA